MHSRWRTVLSLWDVYGYSVKELWSIKYLLSNITKDNRISNRWIKDHSGILENCIASLTTFYGSEPLTPHVGVVTDSETIRYVPCDCSVLLCSRWLQKVHFSNFQEYHRSYCVGWMWVLSHRAPICALGAWRNFPRHTLLSIHPINKTFIWQTSLMK